MDDEGRRSVSVCQVRAAIPLPTNRRPLRWNVLAVTDWRRAARRAPRSRRAMRYGLPRRRRIARPCSVTVQGSPSWTRPRRTDAMKSRGSGLGSGRPRATHSAASIARCSASCTTAARAYHREASGPVAKLTSAAPFGLGARTRRVQTSGYAMPCGQFCRPMFPSTAVCRGAGGPNRKKSLSCSVSSADCRGVSTGGC